MPEVIKPKKEDIQDDIVLTEENYDDKEKPENLEELDEKLTYG